jgi:hypothetical protein
MLRMSWAVIGLAYDIAKYVELINTVSHFTELKEATAVIGILKNDLKGMATMTYNY